MDLEKSKERVGELLSRYDGLLERMADVAIREFLDAVTTQGINQAFSKLLPYMSTEELDELYHHKMEEIESRQNSHTSHSEVVSGLVKDLVGLIYIFRQELVTVVLKGLVI